MLTNNAAKMKWVVTKKKVKIQAQLQSRVL